MILEKCKFDLAQLRLLGADLLFFKDSAGNNVLTSLQASGISSQ